MTMNARRAVVTLLVLASTAGGVACGDDDDSESSGAEPTEVENTGSANTDAAKDLETYLKKETTGRNVISYVESVDGELKIWTLLNAEAAPDEKPAREICRLAIKSGVPEAHGAHLVDAGDAEFFRCR
jgi:hypothetical protein